MIRNILLALGLATGLLSLHAGTLEEGFMSPPESTKPACYWYWISDNISREGITRDLEAMKRVGIGEAFIGNIYLDDLKIGNVKALSEQWWGMIEHAIREGGRIGVKVGMFNCPGWSQSGGPWIKPDQAMRYVATTELRLTGPTNFTGELPRPGKDFQDLALLGFPVPDQEGGQSAAPQITAGAPLAEVGKLIDGDTETGIALPGAPVHLDLQFPQAITARSLLLVPERKNFAMDCELLAEQDGKLVRVRSFPFDRSNNSVAVGFVPHAPVTISFPPVRASKFRLAFSNIRHAAGLTEIRISGEARIERYVEKQLGKMHPTPLPMWGDYSWPATAEPGATGLTVASDDVRNLSSKLDKAGVLRWNVPSGKWIVLRTGLLPTGIKNAPASPEGQGLEVDKMNRVAAQAHFDAYIGKLLARMPKADRTAFERVIADSYEMGAQNWTDGLGDKFRRRYGYDPLPWLPTLSGRVVDSADRSDRFLWDLRRLVADQVAYEYVGGLRDACHKHGLRLWLENYGHWGFPAEFLQYGGQSDELGGEFWSSGNLGSIELRAASSAAHIYGKPRVSAEAFTSTAKFESTPWDLKRRGDWALTEGINHWVLHVNIHQPWEDKVPGVNAWFSTEFNRHNPWFESGREFIDYYRRCQSLLQQGKHVADVAYFIGEDTPKMTGIQHPPLPAGYNFDYINAEIIQSKLTVKNGRFVLPDGMSYSVLALPPSETMRPELLEKILSLVKAGGVLLGSPPSRSPSMQNYPKADDRASVLSAQLWKDCDGITSKSARLGKGRVFRNMGLDQAFAALGIQPQFACDNKNIIWTQRATADENIFFLSNQGDSRTTVTPRFRAGGKAPELWDPYTKQVTLPAVFSAVSNLVRLELEPRGSIFVVFRGQAGKLPAVTEVRQGDRALIKLRVGAAPEKSRPPTVQEAAGNFTIAGWALPAASIALPQETDSGVFIGEIRNDLVTPAHGESLFGNSSHACAGLSVGRNGVVVYEHSANYFAPLLTYAAQIEDWTHFALVYKQGRPVLYLNGQQVHQGLQSKFTVHSGLAADPGSTGTFKGKLASVESFESALDPSAIEALAKAPRIEAARLPAIALERSNTHGTLAEISSPGTYTVSFEDGSTGSVSVPTIPPPIDVAGPWTVSFPEGRDVPSSIQMENLASLSEHSQTAIRHFSGTATYSGSFEAPPVTGDSIVNLDLGTVEGVAEVQLNGKPIGIFWKPPYLVNVTTAFKPGRNDLKVQVSGTWRNRLIGDAKYPDGFPDANGETQFRPFLTADLRLNGKEPLSPFGLIGPVRLYQTRQVPLK